MLCSTLTALLWLSALVPSAQTDEPLGWPLAVLQIQDLTTYAGIDRALESRQLISLGEPWRYFPGTAEPSPDMEWVRADFDDSAWQVGASPFTYGGDQAEAGGTTVEEFGAGVSTLYVRCKFNMPNPDLYAGIWLEMLVDDGYVLYFNKVEERKLGAGDSLERQAFDATASSKRRLDERPMPRFDLTRPIKTGINQIAIQALIHDDDRESFGFYPSVRGIYRSTPESELAHYEEIKSLLLGSESENQSTALAYLEGRYLQRTGQASEALEVFRGLAAIDSAASIVFQRMIECSEELDQLNMLSEWLFEGVMSGGSSAAWKNAWTIVWLEKLSMSLGDIVEFILLSIDASDAPIMDDALWAWSMLRTDGHLRINSGADQDLELNGVTWSRDRFGAHESLGPPGQNPLKTVRHSRRSLDSVQGMYHIPVSNGTYRVQLWGPEEARDRLTHVYVEGTRHVVHGLWTEMNAGTAFMAQVRDGFFDLDLSSADAADVSLCALELTLLDADSALDIARSAASTASLSSTGNLSLVHLAEAEWAAGNQFRALEAFEQAEGQPSFNLEQRMRLGQLRRDLLPAILSFASARDLAASSATSWAKAMQAAEDSEQSAPGAAIYFGGLCHQKAGEIDDAIGYFEQLVFDDCRDAGPYIGMALCLADSELPEDAAGILDLALENGLKPEGDLLQTWISMQLGIGRDPWELVDQLAEMDVPPHLVLVPTSEEYGQPWRFTHVEPSATTWSRPSFSIEQWDTGIGPIGSGFPAGGHPRTLWNRIMLFSRTSFELPAPHLLYPFLRAYGNGSIDTYLNGTRVSRHSLASDGYRQLPLRAPSVSGKATTALSTGLQAGTNLLGMFGYNTRGPSQLDVGIQQDFETLFWIRNRLNEDGALRFNCGGEAFTTSDGRVFHADRFYNWAIKGRLSSQAESQEILGTEEDELYRTTRRFYDDSVSAWYEIPVPNGKYTVILHFAEISAANRNPGDRIFDVTIEDVRQLSAFDVAAEACFMSAIQREFEVQVVDGWMDIKLANKEHFSFLNAFEVIAK